MDISKQKSAGLKLALVAVLLALTASLFLFGCSQEEPDAGNATNFDATPSSGSTSAAVAESSSTNDAADGIYTLDVTEDLAELKTSADVKEYAAELQEDTDEEAREFNHDDPDSVEDANELIVEIGNFNHYLPKLREDGIITLEEQEEYSAQVDQMLLTLDALIAA